ncbi:hypothetical protein PGB90_002748 [Kerria lacca]
MDRFVSGIPKLKKPEITDVDAVAKVSTSKNEHNIASTSNLEENDSSSPVTLTVPPVTDVNTSFDNSKKCEFVLMQSTDAVKELVYSEGVKCKLPLSTDIRGNRAKEEFVTAGFSSWNRAIESFKNHEKSKLHLNCVRGLTSLKDKFRSQTINFLNKIEKFLLKMDNVNNADINEIISFYSSEHFNCESDCETH